MMQQQRFPQASAHLTDNYLAPVPSQFTVMPRAMARTEDEYSTLGYTRALAMDCMAITGGGMDASV